MHFNAPWWILAILGYAIALIIFDKNARDLFLGIIQRQSTGSPARKKKRRRRK